MTAVIQPIQLPPTPTDGLLHRVPGPSTVPSLSNSLSTTPESDELRELRLSFPRRPLPTPPTIAQQLQRKQPQPAPAILSATTTSPTAAPAHVQSSVNRIQSQSRRTAKSSFYMHMSSAGLASISAKPRIFARLLDHLSWNDFHALSCASHSMRRIFLDPAIKEVVFSHFIPGYRRAVSLRDKRVWEDTIRLDYGDLGLFLVSMDTPLHRYPMHAISVLTTNLSELPTVEQLEMTKYLQLLSLVHSRAVLYLQNMVHSTTQPVSSELDDPRWKTPTVHPSPSMRELTFPAPLSYFDPSSSSSLGDKRKSPSQSRSPSEDTRTASSEGTRNSESSPSPSRQGAATKLKSTKAKFDLKPVSRSVTGHQSGHRRKWGSESSAPLHNYASNSFGAINGGRASAAGLAARSASAGPSSWRPAGAGEGRRTNRLSIFGGAANPPPPPSSEPASMRYYSGSWRRVTRTGSLAHGLATASALASASASAYATASDDEGILKPPNRRFLGSSNLSSQSSLNSSPAQSSNGSKEAAATPSSSSPHDLVAATSRTRAPILRVFVPCSSLSEDVIAACEDQLIDDGLWNHLSVGDVVCNFGFVPPIEETDDMPGQQGPEKDHRRWLVYNGERLMIYYPNQAPPVLDPLSLPSPFYYSHILPPFLNPRFRMTIPPFKAQYTLASLTNTITSPSVSPTASPRIGFSGGGGLVRVKTYAWLATLEARMDGRLIEEGWLMNEGWTGEWVLQGEGTREGRAALQDMLRGEKGVRPLEKEFEIVLDKSGSGRLWLRMIDSAPQQAHSSDNSNLDMNSFQLRTPP